MEINLLRSAGRLRSPDSQILSAPTTSLVSVRYATLSGIRPLPRFDCTPEIGIIILRGRSPSSDSKLPRASQSTLTTGLLSNLTCPGLLQGGQPEAVSLLQQPAQTVARCKEVCPDRTRTIRTNRTKRFLA